MIRTFDLCRTLPKYLRTFLHKNALLTIGITDQSGYSICLTYVQRFHPYSIPKLSVFPCARIDIYHAYVPTTLHDICGSCFSGEFVHSCVTPKVVPSWILRMIYVD